MSEVVSKEVPKNTHKKDTEMEDKEGRKPDALT